MEDESTMEYKAQSTQKGPKWVGLYEIVERKGGGNGNYVLKCLSGRNKGKINKGSYPHNHFKEACHQEP